MTLSHYLSEPISMKIIFLTLLTLSAFCPVANAMINGQKVKNINFPAVVKIQIKDRDSQTYICTGTFISPTSILTAKHCLENVYSLKFETPKKTIKPNKPLVILHKDLDLAIIQIEEKSTDYIELDFTQKKNGSPVSFLGFGKTESIQLKSNLRIGYQKIDKYTESVQTSSTYSYDTIGNKLVHLKETLTPQLLLGVEQIYYGSKTTPNLFDGLYRPASARTGDSGGPVLMGFIEKQNIKTRIIGVINQQDAFNKYGTIAVPAGAFEQFIRKHIVYYKL
jgi:hypothetical protein